jgi:hypothetical protein
MLDASYSGCISSCVHASHLVLVNVGLSSVIVYRAPPVTVRRSFKKELPLVRHLGTGFGAALGA